VKKNTTEAVWMVVDDNPSILEMLSSFLGMLSGARIACFQSGQKALAAFDAAPDAYDLVVTDLEMPGMNGVELCDQLHVRNPHLKVVLATGNQSAVDSATAKDFGFSGLLYKPFTFGALEHLLENINAMRGENSSVEEFASFRRG
jgi:CheY-like chemotaxis protein